MYKCLKESNKDRLHYRTVYLGFLGPSIKEVCSCHFFPSDIKAGCFLLAFYLNKIINSCRHVSDTRWFKIIQRQQI